MEVILRKIKTSPSQYLLRMSNKIAPCSAWIWACVIVRDNNFNKTNNPKKKIHFV